MLKKTIIFSYIISLPIFCLGIILTYYDYSFEEYYTDKIVNWTWLGLTITFIFLFWKKKLIKIYFFSLLTFLGLSILPMAMPFMGIVLYLTTIGDYQQIELNDQYRIERTKQQVISIQRIYIYQKKGLFEKNICRPIYSEIIKKTTKVKDESKFDDTDIIIQDAKFISINNDSIGIEYKISGMKKIIYHKLNNNDGY
jgi:hypothetical protein